MAGTDGPSVAHLDSGAKGDSMPNENAGAFPQRFRAWRLAHALLQDDIAQRLHYSRSLISRIETGVSPPTPRFLDAFGRVYQDRLPPGGVRAFFRRAA
jgi:transcriptional regulator with XRE-family HTH domain